MLFAFCAIPVTRHFSTMPDAIRAIDCATAGLHDFKKSDRVKTWFQVLNTEKLFRQY
jgi:hypothetical protein